MRKYGLKNRYLYVIFFCAGIVRNSKMAMQYLLLMITFEAILSHIKKAQKNHFFALWGIEMEVKFWRLWKFFPVLGLNKHRY